MKLNDFLKTNPATPYIIAEIGVNHEGNVDIARRQIVEAVEGGADAVKFQMYKANELTVTNSPSYWNLESEKTTSQFALFSKYDGFNLDDYIRLREFSESIGVEFCVTPFSEDSAARIAPYVNFFKIASADITNRLLIEAIAREKKPVIFSTGAANRSEILAMRSILLEHNVPHIIPMHCTLCYPTDPADANLWVINYLRSKLGFQVVGYSDHVPPDSDMSALVTAYCAGASIFEKHFTHDKSLPGNDHYHSFNKEDLKSFRAKATKIIELMGSVVEEREPFPCEYPAREHARRSIVTKRAIAKGELFTAENITAKRPGSGMSPMMVKDLWGRRANKDLMMDKILEPNDID